LEEAGDTGNPTHKLAGPVGHRAKLAVGVELWFKPALEVFQGVLRCLGELQGARLESALPLLLYRQREQRANLLLVRHPHRPGHGSSIDLPAPHEALRKRVEEAGQQAAPPEARVSAESPEHLGLDRQAERHGWPDDKLRSPADAVHADGVAGVALEKDTEVRHPAGAVAACHHVEDVTLGAHDRDAPTLFCQERRQLLGGDIICQHAAQGRDLDLCDLLGAALDVDLKGWPRCGLGVLECRLRVLEARLRQVLPELRPRDLTDLVAVLCLLEVFEWPDRSLENGRFPIARFEGDDDIDVDGLNEAGADFYLDYLGAARRDYAQDQHRRQIQRRLGLGGLGFDVVS
jgi:hypothetical protein